MIRNETFEFVEIVTIIDEFIGVKKMRNNQVERQANGRREYKEEKDMDSSGGVEKKDVSSFY
tara:strand:- start:206 stop:391 length:186 start_codon:yes stop_codon:yes gene_type:complete